MGNKTETVQRENPQAVEDPVHPSLRRLYDRLKNRLNTSAQGRQGMAESQRKPMTWMIAEDDSAIREVVEMMCELWGFSTISFKDGFQAMEYLSNNHLPPPLPDIALLDIRMPGPWGHEISARIRQHPQISDIGIVLMTAYELPGADEDRYLQSSGADQLLFKPLPPMEELLGFVTKVLERRKANAG